MFVQEPLFYVSTKKYYETQVHRTIGYNRNRTQDNTNNPIKVDNVRDSPIESHRKIIAAKEIR